MENRESRDLTFDMRTNNNKPLHPGKTPPTSLLRHKAEERAQQSVLAV
jgi:hypothetical protein